MRAIFLDRDGVINHRMDDYVKTPEEFAFLPGALSAFRRLAAVPLRIIVVTNQAGVGRRLYTSATLDEIHGRMLEAITEAGGRIDGIYYCPHAREEKCRCRKPEPGLFLRAAAELGIELEGSHCVGDSSSDLVAAVRAGCRGLLLQIGDCTFQSSGIGTSYSTVRDLGEAVDLLVAHEIKVSR